MDAVVPNRSWTRRIVITGLHVPAHIGWTAEERVSPQLLVLDLVLDLVSGGPGPPGPGQRDENTPADDLESTVDYAELSSRIAAIVSRSTRRLLETLAADVLAEVLRDRLVDAATVTVHKPGAPLSVEVDDVAVVVSGRR